MVYQSQAQIISRNNPTNGFAILPAISGIAYRITSVCVSASNIAGSTGGIIEISATNPLNGQAFAITRLHIVPGVANVINEQILMDFVSKFGTSVNVAYYDSTKAGAKEFSDFENVNVCILYNEMS